MTKNIILVVADRKLKHLKFCSEGEYEKNAGFGCVFSKKKRTKNDRTKTAVIATEVCGEVPQRALIAKLNETLGLTAVNTEGYSSSEVARFNTTLDTLAEALI